MKNHRKCMHNLVHIKVPKVCKDFDQINFAYFKLS